MSPSIKLILAICEMSHFKVINFLTTRVIQVAMEETNTWTIHLLYVTL